MAYVRCDELDAATTYDIPVQVDLPDGVILDSTEPSVVKVSIAILLKAEMKIFVIFFMLWTRYFAFNTNTLASSEENNQRIEMLERVGSIYFQEGDLDAS